MITVVGIDHTCIDSLTREKTSITNDELSSAYNDLIRNDFIKEAIWLVTCGRTECIVVTSSVEQVKRWYIDYFSIDEKYLYVFTYKEALEHLLTNACGLNSKIIGETQILGQIKQSINYAKKNNTLGARLSFWMSSIVSSAKEIRRNLGISACPMSMPSMIKQIILGHFNKIEKLNLLIIGTGEIGQQNIHFFKNMGLFNIKVIGRNFEKTKQIAKQNNITSESLSKLPLAVKNCDIVITATSCSAYLINEQLVTSLNLENILMFDLAMPKNIDPNCKKIKSINLYELNYLSELISAQHKIQDEILLQAKNSIKAKIEGQLLVIESKKHQDTLLSFRKNVELINEEILTKGLADLRKGDSAEKVLKASLRKLSRKIMHGPTYTMRKAMHTNQEDYLHYMKIFLKTLEDKSMEKNEN